MAKKQTPKPNGSRKASTSKAKKQPDIKPDGSRESTFSKIKKGEFFRFPERKKVYLFGGGGSKRGYEYAPVDDVNDVKNTKTNRVIEIGFTY